MSTGPRRIVSEYVEHYNNVRLHSAIGYIAPRDRMEGRYLVVWSARDLKLEAARAAREHKRKGGCAITGPAAHPYGRGCAPLNTICGKSISR